MDDQRLRWLALNFATAEDRRLAAILRSRFGRPIDIFDVAPRDRGGLGLSREKASRLWGENLLERAAREVKALEARGFDIMTFEDDDYPALLRETFDPPFAICCWGDRAVLREPAVAVVGARRMTSYGQAVAEKLARELAVRGMVVVSGMALGIDAQAHWGALESGRTVAVLGSGLDILYPSQNKPLAKAIAASGAVITEYPLKAKPSAFHFPLRNRIISGLALAVVVVEATRESGSLITARFGLEQNREVMAVPGPVTSERSAGANWLIQSGAKLVSGWEDVVEELPEFVRGRMRIGTEEAVCSLPLLGRDEAKVWECLSMDAPTHIDELVESTDRSVAELLAVLLNLELRGLVRQVPGKYFQRSA